MTTTKRPPMAYRYMCPPPKDYLVGERPTPKQPKGLPKGLKKIADIPIPCTHPEHRPPSHLVLPPGVYEHTCPACGKKSTFVVKPRTR